MQSCFVVVSRTTRFWNKNVLHNKMFAYIFMHNMIIENEYDVNVAIKEQMKVSTPKVKIVVNKSTQFQEILT